MLTPENVFLAVKPVDMRRGIDTLTQYVQDELKSSRHEGAAFVLTNKDRSRIKVLRWDKHGVWLCVRRLHKGHFRWPRAGDKAWSLTQDEFNWQITGDGCQADRSVVPTGEEYPASPGRKDPPVAKRYSRPIVDKLWLWLEQQKEACPESSALGKAINYMLKRRETLSRFLDDGSLPLDINRCERAIWPVVMGRLTGSSRVYWWQELA